MARSFQTIWMLTAVVFCFMLGTLPGALWASDKPEVFAQTGHAGLVEFVAINPGASHLVSKEAEGYLKTWEVASGREIRTIKLQTEYGRASNIYFVDDSTFMVLYQKTAELYDLYGKKLRSITLPRFAGPVFLQNPAIGKDGQYLFNGSFGIKIYSMKDGSELVLPEINRYKDYEIYTQNNGVTDLGFGYYGVFHKDTGPDGTVSYVLYDDSLNVRRKGSLVIPTISHGAKFKLSPDGKLVAYQGGRSSSAIQLYDLATGQPVFSYTPRELIKETKVIGGFGDEQLFFRFEPDGRLLVGYVYRTDTPQAARMELVLLTPLKNGMYTERKLLFENLHVSLNYDARPYALAANGLLAVGFTNGNLQGWQTTTGELVRHFGVRPAGFRSSLSSGNRLLNWREEWSSSRKEVVLQFHLWDLETATLKQQNVTTRSRLKGTKVGGLGGFDWEVLDPHELYRKVPPEFMKDGYQELQRYRQLQGMIFLTRNTGDFYTHDTGHKLELRSRKTKQQLADLYTFEDGEWIIITPDGYYNASANGDKYLNVRVGSNIYGIENYRETFFRPDLVKLALAGGSLQGYRTLADVKQPPRASIVQTAVSSANETFKLTLKLEEQGGGVGDVRLFLNGSAVVLDSSRSLKAVQKEGGDATYRSYTLKLSPGSNTIRAIAFNADNSMQSNEAVHQVQASFSAIRKPTLHALVIGVQEFRNPKLQLKYAVADADLFAETLRTAASSLFEEVRVTPLTTREATSRDAIVGALQRYQAINPDDLFILYIASHGTVDEGEYFLITSNVGALSTQKLKSDALSQTALKELVANIPSTKKLIVIDTCNAGQLGQAMQTALLTRGMSEDTAMKVLSRAVGSTILSASTSFQDALEGYQGHGLFTWTLVQGLQGKADKGRSGYIKTTDLAAYVEDEVPNLAEKIFKRAQFPTVSISGQGFPVGKVR
ncbi:caspase family protein [Trichlorobacter lovleyi]|uniref:caspase family protein n=1 Tax=Trichlorobacter lovleyi TaxID=313985 RepID=UPI002480FD27|nr:caspase family protein [Trichlorobacter lovleyi]